ITASSAWSPVQNSWPFLAGSTPASRHTLRRNRDNFWGLGSATVDYDLTQQRSRLWSIMIATQHSASVNHFDYTPVGPPQEAKKLLAEVIWQSISTGTASYTESLLRRAHFHFKIYAFSILGLAMLICPLKERVKMRTTSTGRKYLKTRNTGLTTNLYLFV